MAKTQINIRVDEDLKDEWLEYVDSKPDKSLSDLIRGSVAEHIAKDGSEDTNSNEEVIEQIEHLEGRLDTIEDSVKAMKHDQLTEDEVMLSAESAIYRVLEAENINLSRIGGADIDWQSIADRFSQNYK